MVCFGIEHNRCPGIFCGFQELRIEPDPFLHVGPDEQLVRSGCDLLEMIAAELIRVGLAVQVVAEAQPEIDASSGG